ncbi:hypothetical protein [Paenibacillus sp. 1011MAR3C5]|uniref:ATP-dependent DNA ligase n=1 Tax=Paenibacillus sp. 1011MAR3C5 TaxID=1675787 RepID=UPI001601086F|nr:hypothetical protein [Paenibacillus sp. 1011MAR3C5]
MFIQPMLMTEKTEPFEDRNYWFEPIVDGQRLQLHMSAGKVVLLTRHGNDATAQYPELHNVPLSRPADVVLDGEVACLDPQTGHADFAKLQERFRMKGMPRIREARKTMPVLYFVFDILMYNGVDLRELPLISRRNLLESLLENNHYYVKLKHWERDGFAVYEAAGRLGLEGIAGKHKYSRYVVGRSDSWLRIDL